MIPREISIAKYEFAIVFSENSKLVNPKMVNSTVFLASSRLVFVYGLPAVAVYRATRSHPMAGLPVDGEPSTALLKIDEASTPFSINP